MDGTASSLYSSSRYGEDEDEGEGEGEGKGEGEDQAEGESSGEGQSGVDTIPSRTSICRVPRIHGLK